MLELTQLESLANRKPSQLSGGQQQRVAIARSLVNRPRVLLLDEPLGALDLQLRKSMQLELKRLQRKLGTTYVYVTHDQEEAMTMSDRVVVMYRGKIEQCGTPKEIYSHPVSRFVAEFIGETNVFESVAARTENGISLKMESGTAMASALDNIENGEFVNCSVRPDMIRISDKPVDGFNLPGVVAEHTFSGSFEKAIIRLVNDKEIKFTRLSGEKIPDIGSRVYLYWNREDAEIMKTSGNVVYSGIEDVDLSVWNE